MVFFVQSYNVFSGLIFAIDIGKEKWYNIMYEFVHIITGGTLNYEEDNIIIVGHGFASHSNPDGIHVLQRKR